MKNNTKLQNYALVHEPSQSENGAFAGPGVVFANDVYPRAADPSGKPKGAQEWQSLGVVVREAASAGARAAVGAGRSIGRWETVAAGAAVAHDVPDFVLVYGIPARQIGLVGRSGRRLVTAGQGKWCCPQTHALHTEGCGIFLESGCDGFLKVENTAQDQHLGPPLDLDPSAFLAHPN